MKKRNNLHFLIAIVLPFFVAPSVSNAFDLELEFNAENEAVGYAVATAGEEAEGSLQRMISFGPMGEPLTNSLEAQAQKNGFAGSIANVALDSDETFVPRASGFDLIWNEMKFHINGFTKAGVFDISAIKRPTGGGTPVTHRWVISVPDGGLKMGPISNGDFNYKIFARAQDVHVIAYYYNGNLVNFFDSAGNIDPRAYVYYPHRNDCIDIDLKINGPLPHEGTGGTTETIQFCAGDCAAGGVLLSATQ